MQEAEDSDGEEGGHSPLSQNPDNRNVVDWKEVSKNY